MINEEIIRLLFSLLGGGRLNK